MNDGMKCGCIHSLAATCGAFAGMLVALFIAQDACLAGGGRVSDAAWSCEAASGAIGSLWALVTPGSTALAILAAVVAYFAVAAVARRALRTAPPA